VDSEKNMLSEEKPAEVSETKQAGEAAGRWTWVERAVWTDRMLEALETGVKGGVWFSLMDKVYALRNLKAAFGKVRANQGAAGVDHVTVKHFEAKLEGELERLHQDLKEGSYRPQRIRRVYIDKPGRKQKRPLGIPTVRDRVVQTAVRNVVEPIFEHRFAENSYGFRPRRGCKDALKRVLHKLEAGYYWVVDADIESYFDRIEHKRLMKLVGQEVADGRVLKLIAGFLQQEVLEDLQVWQPERGSPQGAVISPLLANIYLNPLDQRMREAGFEMVRYADDLVVLCRQPEEAERALELLERWMEAVGLRLHPEKTKIIDLHEEGFDFLGYHFAAGKPGLPRIVKWPREKSLRSLKAKLKPITKRANGRSLEATITILNPILRGWFEYFQHSHRRTFVRLDGWIRGRLRGILRKRRKLRGRSRGADHQRWPNAYFHERGLFSLTAAFDSAIQSSRR
jgi:RNA-directed DNA polymerase